MFIQHDSEAIKSFNIIIALHDALTSQSPSHSEQGLRGVQWSGPLNCLRGRVPPLLVCGVGDGPPLEPDEPLVEGLYTSQKFVWSPLAVLFLTSSSFSCLLGSWPWLMSLLSSPFTYSSNLLLLLNPERRCLLSLSSQDLSFMTPPLFSTQRSERLFGLILTFPPPKLLYVHRCSLSPLSHLSISTMLSLEQLPLHSQHHFRSLDSACHFKRIQESVRWEEDYDWVKWKIQ